MPNKKPPVNYRWLKYYLYQANQNPDTFNLPPVTHLPASEDVATTLPRMAFFISVYVAVGRRAAYNAAPPVTCGVAIDVPL